MIRATRVVTVVVVRVTVIKVIRAVGIIEVIKVITPTWQVLFDHTCVRKVIRVTLVIRAVRFTGLIRLGHQDY